MFARLDSAAAAAGWALSIVLSHCSERERERESIRLFFISEPTTCIRPLELLIIICCLKTDGRTVEGGQARNISINLAIVDVVVLCFLFCFFFFQRFKSFSIGGKNKTNPYTHARTFIIISLLTIYPRI